MENSEQVLVTGGTGAVGVNCILQLLQKGYRVRTTLRDSGKQQLVLDMLKQGGLSSFDELSFIQADLEADTGWAEAMQGCTYVLHVASPTRHGADEDAMIKPAVEGVLRVLKTARNTGVKRVVLTSSFGALGFSHHDRSAETTETDWTNPNEPGLSAYEKSKNLAERAAWDFMKNEGGTLELAVINPVAIYGPLLGAGNSPSFNLLRSLLNGSMKVVPQISLNVVDIRDVADLHIRAMTMPEAAGERFIATADGEISLPEISRLLGLKRRTLPNWILKTAALFNPEAKRGVLFTKVSRRVSNTRAKKILGWLPMGSQEAAILAAVESMKKFGMI